jgi:hypothetical protein
MAVVSLSFTVDGQNTKIVIDSDGSVVSLASAIEKARSESDRLVVVFCILIVLLFDFTLTVIGMCSSYLDFQLGL